MLQINEGGVCFVLLPLPVFDFEEFLDRRIYGFDFAWGRELLRGAVHFKTFLRWKRWLFELQKKKR